VASFEHLRKHARVREKKKKKKKKRENEKKKREGGAFVNIPFSSFSPSYLFLYLVWWFCGLSYILCFWFFTTSRHCTFG